MNNNPFNDKINKAVAEAARKVMEQSVAEGTYREGGSITHDGVEYDFDRVMSIAEKLPIETCSVDKLSWILKYDTPTDEERIERADITVPLIVTKSINGKLAAIDGLHRLAKAVRNNVKTLPVKYIITKSMPSAKISKQGVAEAKEKEQEDRPDVPFAGPYRDATKPAKDKFGNVIKNRAKSLAKQGMAGVRKEEVEQMAERSDQAIANKAMSKQVRTDRSKELGGSARGSSAGADITKNQHPGDILKHRAGSVGMAQNKQAAAKRHMLTTRQQNHSGVYSREEVEQMDEKAKWRSSSAAKPDPDHDWDRSSKSTGGMRATSDTRGNTGGEYNHSSLENRRKAQVASKGPNAGKTTKASNASLKGRIQSNLANKKSKPNLPEEVEQMAEAFVIHKGKHEPGTKSSLEGTHHGVKVKPVYTDKKEAQTHADKINAGRGYKPGDEKNSLYGGVLYQVSPAKSKLNNKATPIEKSFSNKRYIGASEEFEQIDEAGSVHLVGKYKKDGVTHHLFQDLKDGGYSYHLTKLVNGKHVKAKNYAGHSMPEAQADLTRRGFGSNLLKVTKEEVEQIDELSKKTLISYLGKASKNSETNKNAALKLLQKGGDPNNTVKASKKLNKAVKRRFGVDSAVDKLAGGAKVMAREEVEQMAELNKGLGSHLNRYITKATDDFGPRKGREAGVRLALKKKWGDKSYGFDEPKVKAVQREEAQQVAERLTGKQHKIDANKNGKVDAHDFKLLRSKTKKPMSESYLIEDTTPALSAAMKAIIADSFHMYFKAHSFHWNVEGANFPQYHKFFGDVYEQLFETIDPIAEEIRALGDYAPRSLTELKGSTSIDDSSVQTPAEMFASLLGDNNKIIAGLTNGYSVAEASGEIGLSNFLQDKIDAHKKLGWMIKSTSKGA